MPKSTRSGAPKKARWSTAQKNAVQSGPKKPHRGQSSSRPAAAEARAPRTSRYTGERDERPARRPVGSDHRSERFDRGDRPARRPVGGDRDGAPRSFDRSDRPARSFDRSDRPARSFDRDDRAPRSFDRSDRPARSFDRDDRAPRSNDRTDRPARPFDRSDRPARSFDRSDRPARSFDRSDRPARSFDRSDRPARSFDRDDRAPRSNDRTDRPARSFDRSDRPARSFDRSDRPARSNDRSDRPARSFDRSDRPARSFDRSDRPARSFDRSDRPARSFDRSDRPARSFDRSDRPARSFDRNDRGPRHSAPEELSPEAERMEADTWTKATHRTVTGPAEVTEDNGFAALGLPEALVRRLARDGITAPFPIQTATIPDALAGRDVLGRGQTGSGKTLAFGLPMLTRLNGGERAKPRHPRALIMTPTRELAMQISDALEPLVHIMGLRHKLVAGGLSYTGQLAALDRGIDLLIATPGRLVDLLERGAVDLSSIEVAVLDEADHMADMGFLPAVTDILDRVPAGGQRLLFSATLDKGIDTLVERYLTDPVTHSTDDVTASVETMEHHILLIDPTHKKQITAEAANRSGRTVIFVRTKLGADRVADQLRESGVFAAALHGGLNQGARNRVLGAFRDGTLPVLVATDVAARGIHVDDVSVVLQADPPADHKDYLHRAGRTARAGDRGTVITLALPHQRRTMERLAKEAGVEAVPTRTAPGDEVLVATGASTPSGVPVDAMLVRRVLEGEKRPSRPRRDGGSRPGGFRRDSGPRRDGARREGGPRREFQRDGGPRRGSHQDR